MRQVSCLLAFIVATAIMTARAQAIPPSGTPPPVIATAAASPSASPVPVKHRFDPNLALVGGSADVAVKAARYYDTNDDNGNSNAQEILIATFTFTNDTGIDITPRIDHFEFVDAAGQISAGIESGYTPLVGISNPTVVVKRGDSRSYRVGFLVPQGDAGNIIYDTSI